MLDFLDFEAVSEKAQRDDRVDTKGYDFLTVEQQITRSCEQLALDVAGLSVADQSRRLLNNLNEQDRSEVARELDLNESSDTLS